MFVYRYFIVCNDDINKIMNVIIILLQWNEEASVEVFIALE